MKKKSSDRVGTHLTIVFLSVFILFAVVFLVFRNMDYFELEKIDLKVSDGIVTGPSVEAIVNEYVGGNIFSLPLSKVKASFQALPCVREVKVARFYPSTVNVELSYEDYGAKFWSRNGKDIIYFLVGEKISIVNEEEWSMYVKLPPVEINTYYANMVSSWGGDAGFEQMKTLVYALAGKNLITSLKYDNNKAQSFGSLSIEMGKLSSSLTVKSPVTRERLFEALDVIEKQVADTGIGASYELDGNSLVRW